MFSPYDLLALVCGLALMFKGSKRLYKALGLALVLATLWSALVVPTYNKARRILSDASHVPAWSPDDIQRLVVSECESQGVDPALGLTISEIESNHHNVMGDGGRSYGPMQVQAQYHIPTGDPTDPRVNVRAGVRVLADKLARYGDPIQARLAYVCGTPKGCSQGKARRVVRKFKRAAKGYGYGL